MKQLVNNMLPGCRIWVRGRKPKPELEVADLVGDYSDAKKGANSEKIKDKAKSSNNPKPDFKKSV